MTRRDVGLRSGGTASPLLRAEWTKFRTVRGWVIGMLVAAADHRRASGCSPRHAAATAGPPDVGTASCRRTGGEAVTDSFYFVHQPLDRRRQHHRPGRRR